MQTYSPYELISTPSAVKITHELLNPTQLIVFWLFMGPKMRKIDEFTLRNNIVTGIQMACKTHIKPKKSELKTLGNISNNKRLFSNLCNVESMLHWWDVVCAEIETTGPGFILHSWKSWRIETRPIIYYIHIHRESKWRDMITKLEGKVVRSRRMLLVKELWQMMKKLKRDQMVSIEHM
jgi:hypothetical protein